jgi:hypothetical protein
MNKPQKSTATLDQLRGLMHHHAETHREAQSQPVTVTAVATIPSTAVLSKPLQPPAPKAIVHQRFTVRLNAPELARLGEIVLVTHQRTGQRITPTDILRVGLGRVGEKAPITSAEITALRATDARRNRPQGPKTSV